MNSIPKDDSAARNALSDALNDRCGSPEYRRALTTLIATLDGDYEFRDQEYQQAIRTIANEIRSDSPGTPEACHALAVLGTWSGQTPQSPTPRLIGRIGAALSGQQRSLEIFGRPAAAWARARAEVFERMADDIRRKATSRRYAISEEAVSRIMKLEWEAECWWRGAAALDSDNVRRTAMPERTDRMENQEAKRQAEIEKLESERDDILRQKALAECDGDMKAAAALLLKQANDLDRWVNRVERNGNRVEHLHLHHNAAIAHRSRRVGRLLQEEARRKHGRMRHRIDR